MDATCPHLGANMALVAKPLVRSPGGTDVGDCLQCPFHGWCFDSNGQLVHVPYLDANAECLPKGASVKTYWTKEWCGLILIYFHADQSSMDEPEFLPPAFVEEELAAYKPLGIWNVGHVRLLPSDWVDQAGDHCHFHFLHSKLVIPYTKIELPLNFFAISHVLQTELGDKARNMLHLCNKFISEDQLDPKYIYFTDIAGGTLMGRKLPASTTLEMYIGPALMVFSIPLGDGGAAIKILVTTTPVQGGSVMRVRAWFNRQNPLWRLLAWLVTGVSASQLAADIDIMQGRLRPKRPMVTKKCGPYQSTSRWLKQFYSKSSASISTDGTFPADW